MPAFTEVPENLSLEFSRFSLIQKAQPWIVRMLTRLTVDESSEDDFWTPFHADSLTMIALPEYPPTRGYYVSAFANSCKIAVIIKDMIMCLYSRRRMRDLDAGRESIVARLSAWRENTPLHLRYDANSLPDICPPPHIMCQK